MGLDPTGKKEFESSSGMEDSTISPYIRFLVGSALHKGFIILIQLGHVPFAPSRTGIDLSTRPTEGGPIPMKISELN